MYFGLLHGNVEVAHGVGNAAQWGVLFCC